MATPIQHIVIIVKENHTFDNYFGTFPGATGVSNLAHAPNPPLSDHSHTHETWLVRDQHPVKEQYLEADIPTYFQYARQYTLCDNFFSEVAGPSTPSHLMLVCAASPLINNSHSSDPPALHPPFDLPSLPQNLEAAKLTWRNYGGYVFNDITALRGSKNTVASGQFVIDAAAGKLPTVSWVYAASNTNSEHPTGNVTTGMNWTAQQVDAVVKGGLWPHTVIFITWDDWGGWYDHVTPPDVEKWTDGTQFRYGSRVPCLVLSPFAKPNHISKVQHSHVSLVKFCETTFGLPTINQRDAAADDMSDCFNFTQSPVPPPVPPPPVPPTPVPPPPVPPTPVPPTPVPPPPPVPPTPVPPTPVPPPGGTGKEPPEEPGESRRKERQEERQEGSSHGRAKHKKPGKAGQ